MRTSFSDSETLGKFTEDRTAISQAEELKAAYARISELELALRTIEGGSFGGAATLAIAGAWQQFTNELQGIARTALHPTDPAPMTREQAEELTRRAT